MERKSSSTSFGPFLEALQAKRSAETRVVREARRKLVTSLASTGPEPVEKLRRQVQMRFEDFADAVRDLKDADLIQIESTASDDVVSLTDKGRQLSAIDW